MAFPEERNMNGEDIRQYAQCLSFHLDRMRSKKWYAHFNSMQAIPSNSEGLFIKPGCLFPLKKKRKRQNAPRL